MFSDVSVYTRYSSCQSFGASLHKSEEMVSLNLCGLGLGVNFSQCVSFPGRGEA